MTQKYPNIYWLSDDEYGNVVGHVRLSLNGIMEPLMMYGQKEYVIGAVNEIMKLVEDFGVRIRGVKDKPVSIDYIRRR